MGDQQKGGKTQEKQYSISELVKSPQQLVFLLMAGVTVGMLGPFTKSSYDWINWAKSRKPEGYAWPELADMKLMTICSFGFMLAEIVMRRIFYALFIPFCKEKTDLKL